MDAKQILEKIIENDGSCEWTMTLRENICEQCPFSRDKNGKLISCVDHIVGNQITNSEKQINKLYKQAAEQRLTDLLMEEMLSGSK